MKKFHCQNFRLDFNKPLCKLIRPFGLQTYHEVLHWVYQMPYRRITDIDNFSLVAVEKRGTCSSKHAFLAALAGECQHKEIQLELGYFKFSEDNIPFFKPRFSALKIPYILEAHCYLRVHDQIIDVTSIQFNPDQFLNMKEPIETYIIDPADSGTSKQIRHKKKYLTWTQENKLDFDLAWQLRWDLIQYLVEKKH